MSAVNKILSSHVKTGLERDLDEERQTQDLGPKNIKVEKWVPDWTRKCECCDQKPVVIGMANNEKVYHGTMCGVCTWGEAAMLDPENWNKS